MLQLAFQGFSIASCLPSHDQFTEAFSGIWEGCVYPSTTPSPCVLPRLQANGGAKRQKLSHQSYITYQKQGIRRSTRHRKVRGEKALLVSANQTLKELKIQVRLALLPGTRKRTQNKECGGAEEESDSPRRWGLSAGVGGATVPGMRCPCAPRSCMPSPWPPSTRTCPWTGRS